MKNRISQTSTTTNAPRPRRGQGRRTAWPLLPVLALCASPALAQSDAAVVAVGPSGLAVESADGAYSVGLRGYSQLGGRYFASPEEGVTDELLLRRLRPILTMRAEEVSARVMADLASGFALLDAYLEYAPFEALAVRLGLMKSPFGLELLQSPTAILFLERSLATGLVPNRDVGLLIHGRIGGGLVEYGLGLFNGVADGENGGRDLDDDKDLAARIFVQPFADTGVEALAGLGVGAALTWGEQSGDEGNPLLPRYRTTGRASWFSYASGADAGATAFADGTRLRLTGQLYYHVGGFELIGEYVRVQQAVARGEAREELGHSGYHVGAAFTVGGEAGLGGVRPEASAFSDAGLGALQIAARVSGITLDEGSAPDFASATRPTSARELAFGLNWWLSRSARVLASLHHTSFESSSPGADALDAELVFLLSAQLGL